ncbi:hypothetical protein HGRIS_005110 [Hohenbuehelia grisea]|uniref:ubiquitinyl hydrolase 1 n=1 Tax=Hohenbuehelia grisea TaxID=104357 RepID=A0ABR3JE84_9AGAR
MPGVALLPSPSSGAFNTPNGNSSASSAARPSTSSAQSDDMSIQDILNNAREKVQRETRGATAMTMIKTARRQALQGKDYETRGNLKGALAAYTQALVLAKHTVDSSEMTAENRAGKGGMLKKEFNDFFAQEGADLFERKTAVEDKLRVFETKASSPPEDPPARKSIQDRVKALQNNGLAVSTSKRISREVPMSPPSNSTSFAESRATPSSPPPPSNRLSSQLSLSSIGSPSVQQSQSRHSHSASLSSIILAPSISGASISSPPASHNFVSPSSFGPPSPSSTVSPSSSPRAQQDTFSISEFTQAFPSIDELDESAAFKLPSVPNGFPAPVGQSNNTGSSSSSGSSPDAFRSLNVPADRPSSTPLTPTSNAFTSRPSSPTRPSRSPTLVHKPSNLGLPSIKANAASSSIPSTPAVDKPPIPFTNSTSPKELQQYMKAHKVLLIDVRNRSDFEREHINHRPIVCMEPSILMREQVTSETLEDALVIAPHDESVVFTNRDKFDLVVIYDQNSTSFGPPNSPLATLVNAIYETVVQKILRHVPMLLVGGLDQWKADIGPGGVKRGLDNRSAVPFPEPQPYKPGQNGAQPANGFVNGTLSPQMNGSLPSSIVSSPSLSRSPPLTSSPALMGAVAQFDHRTPSGVQPASIDSRPLLDNIAHARSPAETSPSIFPNGSTSQLLRRPAISRAPISTPSYAQQSSSAALLNGTSPITYPQFPRQVATHNSGSITGSAFVSPPSHYDGIASPPQASINPSIPRRRSDYVDQSQEAVSGLHARPIDYPELNTQIPRPPPVASPPIAHDRQENHKRVTGMQGFGQLAATNGAPVPPRLKQDYVVTYWSDSQIGGTTGLKNLGNTCYMNAPIQCLSATLPFAQFFMNGRWRDAINMLNKMGSQGKLVQAFAQLSRTMWQGDVPYITPIDFRKTVVALNSQYSGSDQHDSPEFLSFLLDIIHEDLNRVITKPVWAPTPEYEAELERLPPQIASDREWRAWRQRNDSLIVDYFQGQLRNRLQCHTCNQTSTTYNVFSMLQLPVPSRSGKISIQKCLDAFFNTEVMEKDDAWECPRCKQKRKASKQLSLARLPPILLIHLKRFETRGRFSDKIDTFVDYPLKGLDLTNLMPPPLPPGADKGQSAPISPDDPRTQSPPYKYDLYGVTNHYGNLTSGHYTAYIASRGGWMSCDDSSVRPLDPKQVVNQKAYVLFYKRVKA